MRSRDTRSFTVELKTKRRSTAIPSPSLWGNAASLFKETPEPSTRALFRGAAPSPAPITPVSSASESDKQPRRILPDLRVAEALTPEEVPAVRATRSVRRKERKTMFGDLANQDKRQNDESLAASDESIEAARVVETTRRELASIPTESDDVLWEESAPISKVTRAPQSIVASTPLIVSQVASQRDRKWRRRVEDLPRGERWKRRLPEVCR